MALINSMESSGNMLFRYRGQIPVILFVASVPVIWLTDYTVFTEGTRCVLTWLSIGLSLLGFFIRSYTIGTTPKNTSGRNTKEQIADMVNMSGIYSTVRHPLYLGNYLMWIGIVLFSFNFWFVICVSLAYWIYYERIMFAEERFLEKKFGNQYLDWSNTVPAFIPSFKNHKKSTIPFSLTSVLRREYAGVFATVIGFLFVAILRDYFSMDEFSFNMSYAYTFIVAGVATLILRTLKRSTKLLREEDRS